MCRVLLMNKQGEREIEKIYGLDKYLKYLENQLGGHGNRSCTHSLNGLGTYFLSDGTDSHAL